MESWVNLIEIWGNTEKLLYIISNKAGEISREGAVYDYAQYQFLEDLKKE